MPLIETRPEDPEDRQRRPSGFAQALMMILAWVGGAAAAVVAAFWILEYVQPDQKVEQDDVNQPVAVSVDKPKKSYPRVKPKSAPIKPKSAPIKPEVTERAKVDRRNFQPPTTPGFMYRYYVNQSLRMQDFGKVTTHRQGMVYDRDALAQLKEATGLQLEGFWETKTEQACDFTLDSTNRGRLWIDGQLVLDNTTLVQPGPINGTRTIQPGIHNVRVECMPVTQGHSVSLSRFQLDVAGAGSSNRINLDQLLRPFESPNPSSDERLQYELAKYPTKEMVTAILPEGGRLLAGLAVSAQADGRVAGVKPIYLGESGLLAGETLGSELGEWTTVVAKPGYAISEVQFEGVDLAVDVRPEFMRIGDESLLPKGAYTQTLAGDPVRVEIDATKQPVIDLQGSVSEKLKLFAVEAVRAKVPTDQKHQMLTYLTEGFPSPAGLKEIPRSGTVKKELQKLMNQSAARLSGKKGYALKTQMTDLANLIETEARSNVDSDEQFVMLLEARRLHVAAGNFKPAFKIMNELAQEFEYDYWKDRLMLFSDTATRASKNSALQKAVADELEPAIADARNKFEFEAAKKLAAGGKVLAASMQNEVDLKKYQQQLKEFERLAKVTKQARLAAKKLIDKPDDQKANRSMGTFFLIVSEDWDAAMQCFGRSGNEDCEFIAKHDRDFTGDDAEIAEKLADSWRRVGKKVDMLKSLANERAETILTQSESKVNKFMNDLGSRE